MTSTTKLYGIQKGLVRKLSLFDKTKHQVPQTYHDSTNAFVGKIGSEAIESHASFLLDQLRTHYQLKRKAYTYSRSLGTVCVQTPQVDFTVLIALNRTNPKEYLQTTEINAFKIDPLEADPTLTQIFDPYCNEITLASAEVISIEDKIDAIETIDELSSALEYPSDASYCTLKFQTINLQITIQPEYLHLQPLIPKGLCDFLRNANEAITLLSKADIKLSLFEH